jgi:hypothetical protein
VRKIPGTAADQALKEIVKGEPVNSEDIPAVFVVYFTSVHVWGETSLLGA